MPREGGMTGLEDDLKRRFRTEEVRVMQGRVEVVCASGPLEAGRIMETLLIKYPEMVLQSGAKL